MRNTGLGSFSAFQLLRQKQNFSDNKEVFLFKFTKFVFHFKKDIQFKFRQKQALGSRIKVFKRCGCLAITVKRYTGEILFQALFRHDSRALKLWCTDFCLRVSLDVVVEVVLVGRAGHVLAACTRGCTNQESKCAAYSLLLLKKYRTALKFKRMSIKDCYLERCTNSKFFSVQL